MCDISSIVTGQNHQAQFVRAFISLQVIVSLAKSIRKIFGGCVYSTLTLSRLRPKWGGFWAVARNLWSRPLIPEYEVPLESPWCLLSSHILLFLKKNKNSWFGAYFTFSKFGDYGARACLAVLAFAEGSWGMAGKLMMCNLPQHLSIFQKIEKWRRCAIFGTAAR